MADLPSPPLCPTQDKKTEKCEKRPLHPSTPHQENFIESGNAGMQELTKYHD